MALFFQIEILMVMKNHSHHFKFGNDGITERLLPPNFGAW